MKVDGPPSTESAEGRSSIRESRSSNRESRSSNREDRWRLADERDFLRRSLEDAAREHEAGDLSDEDHAVLVARDTARLAEVEAELAALAALAAQTAPSRAGNGGPRPGREEDADTAPAVADHGFDPRDAPRPPMALWRRVGIVVSCGLIVLGAVILVAHFVQARQPGQASSGSVTLSQAQQIEDQLQQALALNNEGNVKGALELYDKVLSEDPSNPAALAYAGYLEWNEGLQAHVASLERIGRAQIQTAVKDSPTYYEAHLFYGLVLENEDHNDAAAVAQFDDFLSDGAPSTEASQVKPLVAGAYAGAGVALPAGFTSTTTTSGP
jgi:tetratricopeptide (TPR) repeat protein